MRYSYFLIKGIVLTLFLILIIAEPLKRVTFALSGDNIPTRVTNR